MQYPFNVFQSESAAPKETGGVASQLRAQIGAELTARPLDPKYETVFSNALFPPDRLTKATRDVANTPRPDQYGPFAESLITLNVRIKLYQSFLSALMRSSVEISNTLIFEKMRGTNGRAAALISQVFESSCGKVLAKMQGGTPMITSATRGMITAAMSNTNDLVIKRGADGYELQVVKIAGTNEGYWNAFQSHRNDSLVSDVGSGIDPYFQYNGSSPEFEKSGKPDDTSASKEFRDFYFGGMQSEFGQAVHKAALAFHKFFFGDVPSKANLKSKTVHFDLDTNFSVLNAALQKIPGVKEAIGNTVFFPSRFVPDPVRVNLGPMFKFTVRRVLSEAHSSRAAAFLGGSNSAGSLASMHDAMLPYCGFVVHVGYTLHLPNPVVDYIIQNDDHSAAELLLARWFNRWCQGFFRLSGSRTGSRSNVPRCLTSSTEIKRLNDMRKKLGFPISDSIGDEKGVAVSSSGALVVYPRTQDIDLEVVAKAESALADGMSTLYEHGIPVGHLSAEYRRVLELDLDRVNGETTVNIATMHNDFSAKANRFANVVVGTDPTSGLVIQTSADFLNFDSIQESGAVPAADLEIGDSLGFDFAAEGEAPNIRTGARVLGQFLRYNTSNERLMLCGAVTERVISALGASINGKYEFAVPHAGYNNSNWNDLKSARSPHMLRYAVSMIVRTFDWMQQKGLVPSFEEITNQAKAIQMAYTQEHDPEAEPSNYIDAGLYRSTGRLSGADELATYQILLAIEDARDAYRGGRLRSYWERQGQSTEIVNDWRFIGSPSEAGLHTLGNLRGYLGGALLIAMSRAVFDADRKKVFSALYETNLMPSGFLMRAVLPTAFMIGHAVPDTRRYFEAVEAHVEANQPDDSVSEESLKIAGTHDFTLMPHQFKAQTQLSKAVPPPYATLDIHPGGGKTILGLHDILWCASIMDEPIKPAVIAPKGLVANWCEDLLLISHDWNVIPITNETVKEHGLERIQDLLANAPVNTIYVFADTFIANHHGRFDADIGGERVTIMAQTEFLRRYKFNYVILDESHRVKNSGSGVHASIKQMFLQSTVKFKRLATGTLVPDKVSDVVGQAAMFTPGIFGDGQDIEDASRSNGDGAVTLDAVDLFNKRVAAMRGRFSNYATMASYKRKEWAFMLPNPIETFLHFDIDDPSVPHSGLHKIAYDAVYAALVEEVMAEIKRKGPVKKDEEADTEDDELADEDRVLEEEEEAADSIGAMIASSVKLRQYWQRMEMILSDPMGDPEAVAIFKEQGVKDFIPVKMHRIVDRIKKHFEVQPNFIEPAQPKRNDDGEEIAQVHQMFEWKAGCRPFELDLCEYEGKRYLARKKKQGTPQRFRLPESNITPDKDLDYWKPEDTGKVIVLCEYTRSGDAVIKAINKLLPKKLAKYAIRLGKGADTKETVEQFRNNSEARILVANEQRITEGYNMQIGSRIIRCDTPWSPGRVRQSHARIMRPDFNSAIFDENGKPGDMKREVIFIDWVMTNNTMEVLKVARVTAKDVKTTIWDEAGNPRYDVVKKWAAMQEPPYNADTILDPTGKWINFETYMDPEDESLQHFEAKANLSAIDAAEFAEMRLSTASAMHVIEGAPVDPAAGYRMLDNVPYVPNQRIHDRWGFGLVSFRDYYKTRGSKVPYNDNKVEHRKLFDGVPVHTEWGNGIIVGIGKVNDEKFADVERRQADPTFTTVRVQYQDGSERIVGVGRVHVSINAIKDPVLRSSVFAKGSKGGVKPVPKTKRDSENEDAIAKAEDKRRKQEEAIQRDIDKQIREGAEVATEGAKASGTRKQNATEGKDINAGLPVLSDTDTEAGDKINMPTGKDVDVAGNKVPRVRPPKPAAAAPDKSIEVYPTVYNGLLALYVNTSDSDYKELVKSFGFKVFGEYVYADSLYIKDFYAHLDFLDSVFGEGPFDKASAKRLEEIQNVFSESGKSKFLYPVAYKLKNEVIEFFRTRHIDNQKPNILKAYPSFMRDRMRVMIDLKTNPHARKLVGKVSVGATAKYATWKLHESMAINFVANVTEAKRVLSLLQKAGYTITNLKAVVKALGEIRVRPTADEPKK